jgi:hypothetical protein
MVCLSISEVYRVSPASLPILPVLCALDEGSSGVALWDRFHEPDGSHQLLVRRSRPWPCGI